MKKYVSIQSGSVPSDVSKETMNPGAKWDAPTLREFTEKSWDELSDSERRHIAGHFAWSAHMPPKTFGDLKFPHHDPETGKVNKHGVDNAVSRLDSADIPDSDKAKVLSHLRAHQRQFTKDDSGVGASLEFDAMGFSLPEVHTDHPNRHPFRGVLTRIDEPSTRPPHGSDGHLVMISRHEAEKALPTLIGMAVDIADDLTDHTKKKIGVISEAYIKGNDLIVAGYLYAADFPEEVSKIQRYKDRMGMSFEIKRAQVSDVSARVWDLKNFVFTGAAILLRDKAAYENTSLSARYEGDDMVKLDELREKLEKIQSTLNVIVKENTNHNKVSDDTEMSGSGNDNHGSRDVQSANNDHGKDVSGEGDKNADTHASDNDQKSDIVKAAGKSKRQFMKVCRAMLDAMLEDDEDYMGMDNDMKMKEHEDEEQDMAMLRRLLQKANASSDERLNKIEAALGLITDQLEKVTGLITDKAEKKDGLVTDGADVKAQQADDKNDPTKATAQRRTMSAAKSHMMLTKYGIEEGKDYTIPEIDTILRNAGVHDIQTRMAVKLSLEAAGHLKQ